MILVCGATGGIGGELCKLLKAAGAPFRAMARRQEQVDRFRQQGMDAVLGDFDRPETLAAAMQGCDTMFLITPPNPDQFTQETGAIDAAKRAGVGRVVKISASDGNVRTPVPWARTHALIDHHLRAAGIGWTLLKPTAFMQNFLWFKKPIAKGFLPQVTGDGSVSWVDTRDVARVAAAVLTQEGHAGATYFPDRAGNAGHARGGEAAVARDRTPGALPEPADVRVPCHAAADRQLRLDGQGPGRAVRGRRGRPPRHRSDLRNRAPHRPACAPVRRFHSRSPRCVCPAWLVTFRAAAA